MENEKLGQDDPFAQMTTDEVRALAGSDVTTGGPELIRELAVEELEARTHGDELLLREIAASGVESDDPRISYVVVQVDRITWNRLRALHAR
jgi:hypothetical protein